MYFLIGQMQNWRVFNWLQKNFQAYTSDRASAVVSRNPSQGDRGCGGGGDSQTRLIRRN